MAIVAAMDAPDLVARLAAAADKTGRSPADLVGSAIRNFIDTASDDLWIQLIGLMNSSQDPGLAAMRAILEKALPAVSET
ncbi:hypothetical protein RFM41_31840 [Mesorhizobium sp. VK25A]|uniref:Ribbon-helix-helix protein CopG domain-containing protein n=1 Tax=Mesorhizobium vachelliae TaxID=3072309 RepID=A0ABU5AE98_9HYPH|nr:MULTISPECIES: hypothetical protein [unclassified Mesorhizobium]MDX8535601.1 hypothetical protein [Mesorhizobium sp. VK25D]MDX8548354.1 hypothetical protein [Mesorhizobium sp. VK25A]